MKVTLHYRETWRYFVAPVEPDEMPSHLLPVEVPDALVAAYEAAEAALHEITQHIFDTYGPCEPDPDRDAKVDAWLAVHYPPSPEPEPTWAEYLADYPEVETP